MKKTIKRAGDLQHALLGQVDVEQCRCRNPDHGAQQDARQGILGPGGDETHQPADQDCDEDRVDFSGLGLVERDAPQAERIDILRYQAVCQAHGKPDDGPKNAS